MVSLATRATEPELLDLGVPDAETSGSLADLRFVNRWLGNRPRMLAAMRPHLRPRPDGSPVRLLDVGCGSADLAAWLQRDAGTPLVAVGVDLKLRHLLEAPADLSRVAADVRALPFADGAFDIVMTSLFLHHFNAGEVTAVLRELARVARRAVVVNDLRRARVPYVFGRVTFPFLFRSRVSVNDGLLSIRRAFTRSELAQSFADAGLSAQIAQTWPYRLLAVAEKAGP